MRLQRHDIKLKLRLHYFQPPRIHQPRNDPRKMADRVYATASQHLELCQHICYLLNTRRPIATSTRLYLLDFLVDLRPSPENRIYRLDTRTYHVLRRVLTQIGQEMNVGERHFLQDILRWTVDCHRERVVSRLRPWDGGVSTVVQNGALRERIQAPTSRNSVRCHRCHRYGISLLRFKF